MKTEKSCGAVVFCGDEFILIRHKSEGHWGLPKGHIEEGETEKQAAEREVLEETGLKVKIIDGFREEINYYPKEGILKTVVFFLAYSLNKKSKHQESELQDHKWLKYEDALKLVTYANAKEIFKKAHDFLENR